jgi:hypothetical protein
MGKMAEGQAIAQECELIVSDPSFPMTDLPHNVVVRVYLRSLGP